MKTVVTHFIPDLDAITSVWLIKRFLPNWESAAIAYCPAGKTLNDEIVDSDPSVLHVDTGMGLLDHHQSNEDTCAARKTMEYIREVRSKEIDNDRVDYEVLAKMTDVVNDIDHFRDAYYPNPSADFYDFSLIGQLDGWKIIYPDNSERLMELGMIALDGIQRKIQDKIWAQKEIEEKGIPFTSKWGKSLAIETMNDEVVKLGQKQGFVMVIRKDPKKGYVRIKGLPESKVDLESAYKKMKKLDSDATWFLHVSHKMLLNGSLKNPSTKPTRLPLREIIDVFKK